MNNVINMSVVEVDDHNKALAIMQGNTVVYVPANSEGVKLANAIKKSIEEIEKRNIAVPSSKIHRASR